MKISYNIILLIGVIFPVLAEESLRQTANGTGLFIGSCMKWFALKDDEPYSKLGADQYDLVTACNGCKMTIIAKDWDESRPWNYTGCDYIRNYTR